jgi:hypothetical protein
MNQVKDSKYTVIQFNKGKHFRPFFLDIFSN